MKWTVTNALSRDVERQQLNKILADIRATCEDLANKTGTSSSSVDMDALAKAVEGDVEEGISVTYNNVNKTLDFVVNSFTIRLAGDITGEGEVSSLSSVTINTTIDPEKVGIPDAPVDNQTYWRKNADWEAVPDDLFSFLELEGEGFPARHLVNFFPTWDIRTYQGPDSVKIINGDGAAGDPSWSLDNDEASPAGMKSYSTDNVGIRGWHYPALFESTGMLSNGGVNVLSINGTDNTKFDVAAALYGFVDYTINAAQPTRDVKILGPFLSQTVTGLLTTPETYVGMQVSTGTIIQQATNFTNSQRRTIVPLGVLVHTNLTNLSAVNNLPSVVRGGINQLLDWINYSGRRHRDTIFTSNGVNLNVNRLAGDIWVTGGNFASDQNDPNVIPISAQTAVTFRYRHRNGEVSVDRTTIDPNNYNPTGSTISAVPVNDWSVQRLYIFPSGLNRFQYGQATYAKLEDAIAAFQSESFVTEGNLSRNGTFLGWLIVKQGATDLSSASQAKFITASNDGQPAAASPVLTTTDFLPEGTLNKYFTEARVRATPLTGLSTASATPITAADTVLSADGKLQAQITANGTAISGLVIDSIADGDTTHAPSRNAVFDALALKADDSAVVHATGNETIGGNKSFSGSPTFLSGTAIMSAAAGANRSFRFQTAGIDRWVFGASGAAESGGNAGSAFFINQYSDAGALIGTPLTLDRATGNYRWRGTFEFSPDNTYSVGAPSFRSSVVYSATGTINTSDAREKTTVAPMTDIEIAASKQLAKEIGTFQWLASIEAKGAENARHHVGLTVQRCIDIMQSCGLDPFRYAFICYDEWEEEPEQCDLETGDVIKEYTPAGNRYSLRSDQLNLFLIRGLDARLRALENA